MTDQMTNDTVLCQCGCGQQTSVARQTETRRGHTKGAPMKYIKGHNTSRVAAAAPNIDRVCSNPDCVHGGQPQPPEQFYNHKARCRTCSNVYKNRYEQTRRLRRLEAVDPVDREKVTWLPIEPWRTFVMDFIDRNGPDSARQMFGVDDRVVYRWREEYQRVNLDHVDRALCHAGIPHMLRELYPSLYSGFDDEELAA